MLDLATARRDPRAWTAARYQEAHSDEDELYDAHGKLRYALLIALQYDLRSADELLVRYLFEQEVIAREHEADRVAVKALWLGAFLLARFQRPDDFRLFYRAKFANFDTACSFDRQFLFITLRERTESYVQEHFPDCYPEIRGDGSNQDLDSNLDAWWARLARSFPGSESEECPFELYERHLYLGELDTARHHLDRWSRAEPESDDKRSTLVYAYQELGNDAEALRLLELRPPTSTETAWDRTVYQRKRLQLVNKLGSPPRGLDVIKALDRELNRFDQWKQTGLGSIVTQEAFVYASATDNPARAKAAFRVAVTWFGQLSRFPYAGLVAARDAAQRCGDRRRADVFAALAERERQRIDGLPDVSGQT